MRALLCLIVGMLAVLSCFSQKPLHLQCTIHGLVNGTSVYLLVPGSGGQMDTLLEKTVDGQFHFQTVLEEGPDFCYMQIGRVPDRNNIKTSLFLFLDNSMIMVEGVATNWPEVIVKGSVAYADYLAYKNRFLPLLRSYSDSLRTALNLWQEIRMERQSGSLNENVLLEKEEAKTRLESILPGLRGKLDTLIGEYILTNPHSYFAAVLALAPSDLSAHPESFLVKNPDTYYFPDIFSHPMYVIYTNSEETIEFYHNFSPEVRKSKYGRLLKHLIDSIALSGKRLAPGQPAPRFSALTPEGVSISLDKLVAKNKLTLIDFWASWCKWCRVASPGLIRIYNRYHGQGFTVLGVSVDNKAAPWMEAIRKDSLPWDNVSDLKGWQSPIIRMYGSQMGTSVPLTYLLDAAGKIIAKNLKEDELEQVIKKTLNIK